MTCAKALVGCVEAPYQFLRGVVPPMLEHGGGQVLRLHRAQRRATDAWGAALLVSERRPPMLVRNVALGRSPTATCR